MKKLKLHSNKGGYIQVDFGFAVLIFFIFVFSIYSYYNAYVEAENDVFKQSRLNYLAPDLCEALISSPGYPKNWDEMPLSLEKLGLKSENSNELDVNKINELADYSYFEVLDVLDIEGYAFFNITNVDSGYSYLEYGDYGGIDSFESYSVCYSYLAGNLTKVFVGVWR
ncbi:MAG: hypothetical protein ACOCXG_01795 [Nanoarchaeota archaeon]